MPLTWASGSVLREWRLSRGWDVNRLARELICAAADAGETIRPGRRDLMHMINSWERGPRRPKEIYRLLYLRLDAADDGGLSFADLAAAAVPDPPGASGTTRPPPPATVPALEDAQGAAASRSREGVTQAREARAAAEAARARSAQRRAAARALDQARAAAAAAPDGEQARILAVRARAAALPGAGEVRAMEMETAALAGPLPPGGQAEIRALRREYENLKRQIDARLDELDERLAALNGHPAGDGEAAR